MGRRSNKDMEALQAMIEAMIASMSEDEELSLPFGPGEFDDADGELPETVRVRVTEEETAADILRNSDLDKEDLQDLAEDMYYPQLLPPRMTYEKLRQKIVSFITTQPRRYLAMLPGAAVDAMEEIFQEKYLSFEDWIDDLETLAEYAFCAFDSGPEVVVPEEYAGVYREILSSKEMRRRLVYWRKLEETAAGLVEDADEPVPLREVARTVSETVSYPEDREEKDAGGQKTSGKVLAFERPSAVQELFEDEVYYVLKNRLNATETDILLIDGEDDLYLVAMDWDDEDWDEEDFDDEDWDEEDFDDEDPDDEDFDDEDWDDEDYDEDDFDGEDFDEEDFDVEDFDEEDWDDDDLPFK